ncbi:MAG: DJ-1/PfpI family protein [Acholeplasmataceae bacterium]|jgi:4-methyl-5(b-hydroxyethyl)-thiazole monophosphate biosynthesis|nr:DJ-1/PfpI family protein [Acholeplasmataceae bacterium]
MKGLLLVTNNVEDGEALLTRDLLLRAGLKIDLVSLSRSKKLKTSHGLTFEADYKLEEIDAYSYDFLVIPGGGYVFDLMAEEPPKTMLKIGTIAINFYNSDKLIAAICAGPMLLNEVGILKNKKYTCFPGCETNIDGIHYGDKSVVVDDNIITGRSVAAVVDFSYEIVKHLKGEKAAKDLLKNIVFE